MGSETVIRKTYFRNSCGLFLRDFDTVYLYMFSVLHVVFFLFIYLFIYLFIFFFFFLLLI